MKKKILLAEDEESLALVLKESLERKNFLVEHARDGLMVLELFRNQHFDCILLDVMMPKLNGWHVAEEIRKHNSYVPIMFMTAKSEKEDLITGYASGGNDYLKKPFHLEEFLLRIHELLNRNKLPQSRREHKMGNSIFYPFQQEIRLVDEIQKLSYKETELLKRLVQNNGEFLERKKTLIDLWGDDSFFNARTMDVYISKLRKKLKNDPGIEILNIRGFGYKLIINQHKYKLKGQPFSK